MARGLNKVMIIGHIQPNDPELRYTQSGQPVCTFKMVTDESYKDREGNLVERAEWHNIVFWGKAGEIINQYMRKGRQLYIEGRIQTRRYEDKEGQTRYITEIVGSDFAFLDGGGRSSDSGGSGNQPAGSKSEEGSNNNDYSKTAANASTEEDDLPF